jgi:hypothetical protein
MGKCCYILDIVLPFGTFCVHLVNFSGFGIMHQEKSGNPVEASLEGAFSGCSF